MNENGAGMYYPVMLDITGKRCVVVGGGTIAERKIESLLASKANVTVISPALTNRIEEWAAAGKITVLLRGFEPGDTEGALLVIAASNVEDVNEKVCTEARDAGRLVSVVDRPETGSFIVPAAFTRGKLQVAVSTSGASPALARDMVRELKDEYGPEYATYLDFLSEFRLKVRQLVKDAEHRHALAREIVRIDLLERIRRGEFESFRRELMHKLEAEPESFGLEAWL
ncbi:bifunctional precorrin-2 dehydrogenase/sirohydrochlorin ferrochelatase [Paenibacillus sp. MBLB4367]|uniref:precorrin-2 dehydrogenase/sirohydrochlorin ferrochelatase family protein n=1 Tax=Paenibacillus sp. MBLB4367 TaxID=3384767 RepID=UPI0039081D88